jgi:NAD(P)-dependent dehydrogenase (short-subunit alcohol dehydrogenase family)
VNLKGTFALLHHTSAYWRDQSNAGAAIGGRVVNTVSGAGLFGSVGQASYGASKAAIANLTATAALELARYNVTVNAISPSARTEMTKGLGGMPAPPGPNMWDPLDPANSSPVVAWLVSDRSHWLTGAVLRVRGNTVVQLRPWAVDAASTYTAQGSGPLTVEELDDALRQHFVTTSADPPPGW